MNRAAEQEETFGKRVGTSKACTPERLETLKLSFGSFVPKTPLANETAKEIFSLYKRKENMESYVACGMNRDASKALCFQDYYMRGGLAFIILITAQIEAAFRSACPEIPGKTPDDILLEERGVRIRKKN
ncbi:MAG: hypothetical protein RBR15_10490 [Sphaerochaeta sp.]|nr:hypothetical protein [Sphaerochaeta sp.]